MIRLRIGKFSASAGVPTANSLTSRPSRGDLLRERAVPRRIDEVEPGADDGDRRRRRRRARLRARRRRCRARARRRRPSRRRRGAPRRRARSRGLAGSGCGCRRSRSPVRCSSSIASARVEEQRRVGAVEQRRADSADRRATIDVARLVAALQPLPSRRQARLELLPGSSPAPPPAPAATTAWRAQRSRRAITASGEPKRASSARAASRPTPGVSSRRSHAENSSRSIMCRRGRRGDGSRGGTQEAGFAAARGGPPLAASLRLGEAVAAARPGPSPTGSAHTTCG